MLFTACLLLAGLAVLNRTAAIESGRLPRLLAPVAVKVIDVTSPVPLSLLLDLGRATAVYARRRRTAESAGAGGPARIPQPANDTGPSLPLAA